jgi:hypothetical protein
MSKRWNDEMYMKQTVDKDKTFKMKATVTDSKGEYDIEAEEGLIIYKEDVDENRTALKTIVGMRGETLENSIKVLVEAYSQAIRNGGTPEFIAFMMIKDFIMELAEIATGKNETGLEEE